MKSFFVLIAIIGISAAMEDWPPTYGNPAPASSYGSAPTASSYVNQGYHGPYRQDYRVAHAVDSVSRQLDTLEVKENAQMDRVAALADSANANLDNANNFRAFVQAEIQNEQNQQDYRLHGLEARLSQIQTLRAQVSSLDAAADGIRAAVEEDREQRKQFMYDVNDIQNGDVARTSRIEETKQRAKTVELYVDDCFDILDAGMVSLFYVETNVRRVVDSVNGQTRHGGGSANVSPNGANGNTGHVFAIEPPQAGASQATTANPIGFRAVRGHSYIPEYPSIHFGISQDVWNDRAEVVSMDASAGGWAVDKATIRYDNIYYDTAEFQKSFLDGI